MNVGISSDSFGFIPAPVTLRVKEFAVAPVESFEDSLRRVVKEADSSSTFFYPPVSQSTAWYVEDGEQRIFVGGRRVEHLLKLPPTHEIKRLDGKALGDRQRFRLGEGGVVIHTLAFLYRVRAQFTGWWFDGRVPIKPHPICLFGEDEASRVLTEVLCAYRRFKGRAPRRFLSTLYLKGRTESYEWFWERFLFQYMIFDGLYRCLAEQGMVKEKVRHRERFEELAGRGLIHWSEEEQHWAKLFSCLRNDLIHEVLWSGETPTSDRSNEGVAATLNLRRLNERLILVLAGVQCSFARSPWTVMGSFTLALDTGVEDARERDGLTDT